MFLQNNLIELDSSVRIWVAIEHMEKMTVPRCFRKKTKKSSVTTGKIWLTNETPWAKTSRVSKWNYLYREEDNPPIIDEFIQCILQCFEDEVSNINFSIGVVVSNIYSTCSRKVHCHYKKGQLSRVLFNNPRYQWVIKGLESVNA